MDTPYPGLPSAEKPIAVIVPIADVYPIGTRVRVKALNTYGAVSAWGGSPIWYVVRLDQGGRVVVAASDIARAIPHAGWRPIVVPR